MGGTIGFFVSGIAVFLLSNLLPSLRDLLTNPILLMVVCVMGIFIGDSIEKNGRLTTGDVKEAVKGGVGITFSWLAIWIGIGVVVAIFVFFLKAFNFMPNNY